MCQMRHLRKLASVAFRPFRRPLAAGSRAAFPAREQGPAFPARRASESGVRGGRKAGADTEAKESIRGGTPLHSAAGNGHEAVARLLLEAGADPNTKGIYGGTPLHDAAYGHASVARLLLEAGADLNAKDNEGETPLVAAFRNGKDSVAGLLLEAGARMP